MSEHWSPTIQEAFDVYMLDGEARRFTQATLEYYHYRLTPFVAWCQQKGATDLRAISANHIRLYLAEMQRRELADYSLLAAARALRAFFNFCVREAWLDTSPMARVQMPKVAKRIMPSLTVDEVKGLLRHTRTVREQSLVLFLLDTGMRASEVIALNVGDIDIRMGSVLVREGKGRKQRMVYLGAKTRRQLIKYLAVRGRPGDDKPVWVSDTSGQRLTKSGLIQLLRRLGSRASVAPCTPHTFRRTFALWSLRAGMNIYALQRLMGHEDLTVLRRYLALVESDLQSAHERFGAVDNML